MIIHKTYDDLGFPITVNCTISTGSCYHCDIDKFNRPLKNRKMLEEEISKNPFLAEMVEEMFELALKAGHDGLEIKHGRPVVSPEMAKLMNCPFLPWEENLGIEDEK